MSNMYGMSGDDIHVVKNAASICIRLPMMTKGENHATNNKDHSIYVKPYLDWNGWWLPNT
jgi:hypothetical protein